MKLVPYEPWHYEYLAGLTYVTHTMGADTVGLFAAAYYIKGHSFSIEHNHSIVGCAGIVDLWPGVGEAWSMFSQAMKNNPYFTHRKTMRIINDLKQFYHRVQATVKESDIDAVTWIKRLGFYRESIMKEFGADKQDFGLYVWRP